MHGISDKLSLSAIWLLAAICLSVTSTSAQAQVAHQSGASSSETSVSHQMNQPPPAAGDRHDVSPDRLDEIRQLYFQAKQEQEGSKDVKPQPNK